jgi:hypothetical protein
VQRQQETELPCAQNQQKVYIDESVSDMANEEISRGEHVYDRLAEQIEINAEEQVENSFIVDKDGNVNKESSTVDQVDRVEDLRIYSLSYLLHKAITFKLLLEDVGIKVQVLRDCSFQSHAGPSLWDQSFLAPPLPSPSTLHSSVKQTVLNHMNSAIEKRKSLFI